MAIPTWSRAAVALAVGLALAAAGGRAAAAEKGTTWESTVQVEMAGAQLPPTTTRTCQPKKGFAEPPASRPGEACRTTDVQRGDHRMSWKIECTGSDAVTGQGQLTWTATTYSGTMIMRMREGVMTARLSGREVGGDCDLAGGDPATPAPAAKGKRPAAPASPKQP